MKAARDSLQIAELEQRMRQADADWEALTRSIQADQQHLAALVAHLDRFRLLCLLLPGEPADEAPAIAAQMERLEQQITLLGQCITSQQVRRNALERQFEQARLARAALLRAAQQPASRLVLAQRLLASCIRRSLHGLVAFLGRPENYGVVMPNDLELRRHASTNGQ